MYFLFVIVWLSGTVQSIASEMTYVSSRTLNRTQLSHSISDVSRICCGGYTNRGVETEGYPLPSRLEVKGSVVSSPSGVRSKTILVFSNRDGDRPPLVANFTRCQRDRE